MIVAIHQPNFLPWLGFFHKLCCAQVFVLLDNVPYTKNGYQNRVKIRSAQGEQWLTVPVLTKGRFGQLTNEVPIDTTHHWQRIHLRTWRTNYHRAPYYDQIMEWLKPFYVRQAVNLADFNQALIRAIVEHLGVPTELVLASSLVGEGSGPKLLLDLVKAVGGDVYLSGASGRDYLDLSIFKHEKVEVRFQEFRHPAYPQLYGDFIPGLSIIDMLMNLDPDQVSEYLRHGTGVGSGSDTESSLILLGEEKKGAKS